jgi:hypothetical protein
MATGNSVSMTTQQTVNQIPPRGAPTPEVAQAAMSPPSRRELASWWKKFRKTTEKEDEKRGSSISSNAFSVWHRLVSYVRMGSSLGEVMHSPFPHTGLHVSELPPFFGSSMLIIEQPLQFLESSPFPWPKVSDMQTSRYLFPMTKVKVSSMVTFRSWWPNVECF